MRTPGQYAPRPRFGPLMRLANAAATCAAALLLPLVAPAQENEATAALLTYLGIDEKKLASLGGDPLVVEIPVEDRSRQAAFAGLVRVPLDGAKLFFGSAPSSPPNLIDPASWGYFSKPAALENLASLDLAADDYEVLAECEPANCRFKLDATGIQETRSIDWKSKGADQRFLAWFRDFLVQSVARYRKEGVGGLPTYADKKQPFPVARGIARLAQEAAPLLGLYPGIQTELGQAPPLVDPTPPASDRVLWSISDFGYRPTLSVDRVIVRSGPDNTNLGGIMAMENLYSNHYLAGRLQMGGTFRRENESGKSQDYFWVLDQILFDDKLSGLKRSLLSRGLKSNLSDRLKAIRKIDLTQQSTGARANE